MSQQAVPTTTAETPVPPVPAVADPAPLGLGAFALTTFVLSVHNAGWAPDIIWVGLALFYGGLAQFMAGMWEFRNRNTFGATAFTSYGAFWLSLGAFVILILGFPNILSALLGPHGRIENIQDAEGWFILAFAIFNTYMLLWSTKVSAAVFAVFFTLEVTEIILFIGFFTHSSTHGFTLVNLGGIVGVVTAATAWYASAAGVVNSLSARPVLPVGRRLWP